MTKEKLSLLVQKQIKLLKDHQACCDYGDFESADKIEVEMNQVLLEIEGS